MSRQDDNIFKCAKRMIEKMNKSPYRKLNGQYPPSVQTEIERMKDHCRDAADALDNRPMNIDTDLLEALLPMFKRMNDT